MPAVTADEHPRRCRASPSGRAVLTARAGHVGDHRAARLRGRGLPGPPRVRRRRPASCSTRSSTWTRWARSSTRPGEPKGTAWHPHRGFETVTYIIDGEFQHSDSNGGGGLITNGDTQWMTAGGGILHIEVPPEHLVICGGLFHGFQLWVNLPKSLKFAQPRYQDIRGSQGVAALLPRRRRAAARHRRRGRRRTPARA